MTCRQNHLSLNVGIEINDVHTILHALSDGNWGTILTQTAVQDEARLVQIPLLCADKLTSQGFLFWPNGTYRKKSALAFAEILRKIPNEL